MTGVQALYACLAGSHACTPYARLLKACKWRAGKGVRTLFQSSVQRLHAVFLGVRIGALHQRVQQRAEHSWLPPLPPSPPPPQSLGVSAHSLTPKSTIPPSLPPAVEPSIPFTPTRAGVIPFYLTNDLPSPFLRQPPEPCKLLNPSAMLGQPSNKKPDYLCLLMESQHSLLLQAQQDCAASADRMTRFEEASACRIVQLKEAILLLSAKDKDQPGRSHNPTSTSSNCVDLQRFRTANGPIYAGPFQDVKAFISWLAETVVYGLPGELKALVRNHELLLKQPFRYSDFKSCTQLFFDGLPRKAVSSR
ncbi:hypothetical protein PCANC_28713 [Puccinia coronata f. sp. avenae]|uniref:Uncharacterized protein n=1 Tax=Puccinia coronata f. sp. avenae TaxID=200324 RepID=A0A2N5RX77_9BASI|nr:hypothetical protein PCANC_28713 [Puccinia coronata f. sp. avenae]